MNFIIYEPYRDLIIGYNVNVYRLMIFLSKSFGLMSLNKEFKNRMKRKFLHLLKDVHTRNGCAKVYGFQALVSIPLIFFSAKQKTDGFTQKKYTDHKNFCYWFFVNDPGTFFKNEKVKKGFKINKILQTQLYVISGYDYCRNKFEKHVYSIKYSCRKINKILDNGENEFERSNPISSIESHYFNEKLREIVVVKFDKKVASIEFDEGGNLVNWA